MRKDLNAIVPPSRPDPWQGVLRLREPLAVVTILVVAVNLVFSVVQTLVRTQEEDAAVVLRSQGGSLLGLLSLFLSVMVGLCVVVEPPTRHARVIALVASVLVSAAAVASLVFLVGGLIVSQDSLLAGILESIGGMTDLTLKVIAALLLWQMSRRVRRGSEPPRPGPRETEPPPPLEGRGRPVTGPPDASTGARWSSAADAARGGEASWGRPSRTEADPEAGRDDLWGRRG